MKTTVAMGIGLILAMVAGCAAGRFGELPEQDQKLFSRCQNAIYPAKCGDDKDAMYRTICLRDAMSEYAEERSRPSRHRWLASYGCPPSMIEPEMHVARDVDEEPEPPAQRERSTRHAVHQKAVILQGSEPGAPSAHDDEDPSTVK